MNSKTGWATCREDMIPLARLILEQLDVVDAFIANLYPQNTADC